MGIMIGDAMGMPVEMMTAKEIKEQTGGITGFIKPLQKRVKDTADLPAGTTTDDWALTKAVAESIIRCKGFDLLDVALAHVAEQETSQFGWGRNTRTGIEQIKLYFDSRGKEGRRPGVWRTDSVGCGNGVAMKVASLAVIRSNSSAPFEMGSLTHGDKEASVAANGMKVLLEEVIHHHLPDIELYTEQQFIYGHQFYKTEFSIKTKNLTDNELLFGPLENLIEKIGTGCNALESVPFSIALFIRNKNDFRKGMLEAVNAGGDTDSIAAMTGALIGANVGIGGIPEEWATFSKSFNEAIELGTKLHELNS